MHSDTKLIIGFLIFSVAVVGGVLIDAQFNTTPRQRSIDAELAARELARRPETAPIRGFESVVNAPDGTLVKFDVYVDEKTVCRGLEPELDGICTIAVWAAEGGMLVRLRTCSPDVTVNCLRCNGPETQVQSGHIRAVNSRGDEIEFVGTVLSFPRPIRLTGVVTHVNGSGRIVEPIIKIEPTIW